MKIIIKLPGILQIVLNKTCNNSNCKLDFKIKYELYILKFQLKKKKKFENLLKTDKNIHFD